MALNRGQILVFTMTWVIYASSYLLRKPLGVVSINFCRYILQPFMVMVDLTS